MKSFILLVLFWLKHLYYFHIKHKGMDLCSIIHTYSSRQDQLSWWNLTVRTVTANIISMWCTRKSQDNRKAWFYHPLYSRFEVSSDFWHSLLNSNNFGPSLPQIFVIQHRTKYLFYSSVKELNILPRPYRIFYESRSPVHLSYRTCINCFHCHSHHEW